MNNRKKILLAVSPLIFVLDQFTKGLIVFRLAEGGQIPIWEGWFDIVHTRNPGAAFGTFASLPDAIRLPFFYTTSLLALLLILIYYFQMKEESRTPYLFLAMIFGGAIGNISDRLFRREVVDFLSFHWRDQWADLSALGLSLRFKLEWPAFNVADAAITIGVAGLSILMIKGKERAPKL